MMLTGRPEVGTIVTSERTLELLPGSLSAKTVQSETLKQAVAAVQPGARETSIELQFEPVSCPDNGCPTVSTYHEFSLEFGLGSMAFVFV